MRFQVIKDNFFNRILEKIDEHFPSFHSVFDKEDGVYPVLGELGTFIIGNYNQDKIKMQTINFINEAIEQGDTETEDAIVLQLFQKFYEDDIISDEIISLLNPNARSIFVKYLKEYNK